MDQNRILTYKAIKFKKILFKTFIKNDYYIQGTQKFLCIFISILHLQKDK